MRTSLAASILTLTLSRIAVACDPPPYVPDKLIGSSVVKDPAFVQNSDDSFWRKLQDQASPFDTLQLGRCGVFQSDIDIPSLAGSPAVSIRVTAIRAAPDSPQVDNWSSAVSTVQKVWAGKFRTSTSSIIWSEGNPWTVSAIIDYANGATGSLLTDGVHVRLQDILGRYWYLRLLPAAQ